MALTSTGLSIKRLPEILAELEASLKLELGADVDLSSNSLLGVINSIYAAARADDQALLQAVYDAFNIDTAEGKQLDDLVALTGITRLPASPTNGDIEFSGDPNTTIPTGTTFTDLSNNTYRNSAAITISETECTQAVISVTSVLDSNTYTVIVDGDTYPYTSGVGASNDSIVAGLVSLIGVQPDYTATSEGSNLVISSNETLNTLAINVSGGITSTTVTSVGSVSNIVNGVIEALANTITTISTPVSGLNEVNNPTALNLGRQEETDEELRVRQRDSVQIAGSGTVPAIESTLPQIQGVTQAIVIENRGVTTDGEGRPLKSYECVVEGGSDEDIGQTIWNSKPAGVETYGNISEIVLDNQGNNQVVSFSRPEPQYIWAKISYTLYDEEVFPSNGEQSIKDAVATLGNTLNLGQDVIPKRFYGVVYAAVDGIEDLVITMATSGGDPNTEPTAGSFSTNAIDITGVQVPNFLSERITTTLV